MKRTLAIVTSLLLVAGVMAQKQIVIKNTANFNRTSELVEVKAGTKHNLLLNKQFVLKNEKGQEIAYQLVYNKDNTLTSIIFQAHVNAKSSATYQLTEGKPAEVKFLTYARYIPERKDDFAWENDLAAYRMYGPALANENPSNGVDLWLKRTSDTIINKRFRDELQNGLSYHVDRGNGLDCYKVGQTLGAGGIAPFQNNKLWVGSHYDRFKVLENGPLRSTFVLYYDKVKIGSEIVSQEITISTMAGCPLNKATVKYSKSIKTFDLAAGIYTHEGKGATYSNPKKGIIAYAEDSMQDAKTAVGRNYVGVIMTTKTIQLEQDKHLLISTPYESGSNFSYYFGGGWSKWKYPSDKDWFNALDTLSRQLSTPLKVSIK